MTLDDLIVRISDIYEGLSPQLQRAARYALDNPSDIGLASLRQVARRAAVTPNTLMRLARAVGFDGYSAFREPFQEALRGRGEAYTDRARWLQTLAERDGSPLFGQMAAACIANTEQAFAGNDPAQVQGAARVLAEARRVYVLGMRGAFGLAHYVFYVGRMALPNLVLAQGQIGLHMDEMAAVGPEDAVLALAFSPYVRETVQAVHYATGRGAAVVSVTDSRVSPIATGARHVLLAPTASPQFFPSMCAATAVLEALLAEIVARGDGRTLTRIGDHDRFQDIMGVYWGNERQARPGPGRGGPRP